MTNKVENTKKMAEENPSRILFEAMVEPKGHIERMEARGTQQLSESSVLPSDGLVADKTRLYPGRLHREWADKCGIKILGLVEGDDVFVNVELPQGWKQECTDHGMWNKLLDEKGRTRAMIFYKAAFYDRSAHIHPEKRFQTTYGMNPDDFEDKRCWAIVKDCGEEIWRGEVLEPGVSPWDPNDPRPCMQMDKARKQAEEWLKERHPDHEDLNAYWD